MQIKGLSGAMDMASMQAEHVGQDGVLEKSHVTAEDREKLREVSEEFESVFLDLVLKSMRNTVPKSELMDGGNGEEIFRSMLDTEHAKNMAKQRMTGIASTIEKDLLKAMEVQSASRTKEDGLKAYADKGLREK